ncbi:unnamed protein product [Meloidogyne enterolobii]|uniref:Uncharacterized protein n=1 Tax=Meloidogyne enterolobii TaxID=390850 RepID=A0ACB0YGN8_MELEN
MVNKGLEIIGIIIEDLIKSKLILERKILIVYLQYNQVMIRPKITRSLRSFAIFVMEIITLKNAK